MGLFNFLKAKQKSDRQFVTEREFKANLVKQMQMTPRTMEQLRKIDVTSEEELRLEYFFYTNTADKASIFAKQMAKLNYQVEYRRAAGDKTDFIITGWTTKMKMEESVVANWTKEMCELGHKFDCDFDGWGTSPDQK